MSRARTRREKLLRSASRQAGLFTFEQARRAGYPRATISKLVERGEWIRVLPRVYKVAGPTTADHEQLVAAWLSVGEPAAISGFAAAHVWGVEIPGTAEPEVTVPWKRSPRIDGMRIVRTRCWSSKEMVLRGTLRVTSPMRTLLDLAEQLDELDLEIALDDAHRKRLIRLEPLDAYLADAVRRHIPGAARLRALVALRDPNRPTDSSGETKLFRRIRLAGLPLPVPRFWITTRSGLRRIDLAYPEQKVAIEYHSYEWHDGRIRLDEDSIRDSELADAGWERRYITSTMVDDPSPTLELTIATALGLRPVKWRPTREPRARARKPCPRG